MNTEVDDAGAAAAAAAPHPRCQPYPLNIVAASFMGPGDKVELSNDGGRHSFIAVHLEWHWRSSVYRSCLIATEEIAPHLIYGPFEAMRRISRAGLAAKRILCPWAIGPDGRGLYRTDEESIRRIHGRSIWSRWDAEATECLEPAYLGWPEEFPALNALLPESVTAT